MSFIKYLLIISKNLESKNIKNKNYKEHKLKYELFIQKIESNLAL